MNKIKLFVGMLIAASLSGVAIVLSLNLAGLPINFLDAVGYFLAFRVMMFMSTKDSELTPNYVHYLSVERSKWAGATIAVSLILILIKKLYFLMI
jgi:fumarate reductase subunit C